MAGARFPKRSRLLEPQQFRAVFDGPQQRLSAGELLLLSRPNQLPHARIGIVIGKKVSRRACDRNRFKRVIRESFRHQHALAGQDIIVLARRGIADLDNPEINRRIHSLWLRLIERTVATATRGSPRESSSP
jgi:ribonuclease P protein component